MKIPKYISEGNINASELRTASVPDAINLSSVIGAVEERRVEFEREKEDAFRVFTENEKQRTSFEIDKKYSELSDKIASGGAYAKADKEFSDFYDKTVKSSLGRFGEDQSTASKVKLAYERQGFEYGMRLKSSIKKRAESDAIATAKQREEVYQRDFFNAQTPEEQKLAIQKYSSTISGLEASGIINDGQSRIQDFISNGVSQKAVFTAQTDPVAALEMVEQNKDMLDINKYISLRGSIKSKADNFNRAQELKRIRDLDKNNEPHNGATQEDVDGNELDASRQLESSQITIQEYEKNITETLAATGKVPTSVRNSMATSFSMSVDELTPDIARDIAMQSRIVSNAVRQNGGLVNGRKNGISKDMQLIASQISKKTGRGVDEFTAVRESLRKYNDPAFNSVYESAKKNLISQKQGYFGKSNYEGLMEEIRDEFDVDSNAAMLVRDRVIDDYAFARAMGASEEDAKDTAFEKNKGFVGNFNGVGVKLPPHKVTTLRNEEAWVGMAQKKLESINRPEFKDAKAVLQGDELTERAISKGYSVDKVPFRLFYKDTTGAMVPAMKTDENGNFTGEPVYVTGNAKMKKEPKEKLKLFKPLNFGVGS